MFKKKNKQQVSLFSEYIKDYGEVQFYQYLEPSDILNLALTSKKFYLLMNSFLSVMALDEIKQGSKGKKNQKSRSKSKGHNKKKNKKQNSPRGDNQLQEEV